MELEELFNQCKVLIALENYRGAKELLQVLGPHYSNSQLGRFVWQDKLKELDNRILVRDGILDSLDQPGRILLPLVFQNRYGCVRVLRFEEREHQDFWQESMQPAFREAIRAGYQSVLYLISRSFSIPIPSPHSRYRCCVDPFIEGTDAALSLDRRSVALPSAIAFYSKWSGKSIPNGVVLTGDIDPKTGRVKKVECIERKLEAMVKEAPDRITKFIIPADNYDKEIVHLNSKFPTLQIIPVEKLEEALSIIWTQKWTDIRTATDSLVSSFEGADLEYKNYRHEEAGLIYERIIQLTARRQRYGRIHYIANWRYGATLTHLARWKESNSYLDRALKMRDLLLTERKISTDEYFGLSNNYAHLLSDAYQFEEAIELMNQTIIGHNKDKTTLRELARSYGTRAQVYLLAGRFSQSITDYRRAISNFRKIGSLYELPRDYCWLGLALAGSGKQKEGLEAIRQGNKLNEREVVDEDAWKRNRQYLMYATTRIYAQPSTVEECQNAAQETLGSLDGNPTWLGAMTYRYLAEAMLSANRMDEASVCIEQAIQIFKTLHVVPRSKLEGNGTYYPLAATPYLLRALYHIRKRNKEELKDAIQIAVTLIRRHKCARPFFDPYVNSLKTSSGDNLIETKVRTLLQTVRY